MDEENKKLLSLLYQATKDMSFEGRNYIFTEVKRLMEENKILKDLVANEVERGVISWPKVQECLIV